MQPQRLHRALRSPRPTSPQRTAPQQQQLLLLLLLADPTSFRGAGWCHASSAQWSSSGGGGGDYKVPLPWEGLVDLELREPFETAPWPLRSSSSSAMAQEDATTATGAKTTEPQPPPPQCFAPCYAEGAYLRVSPDVVLLDEARLSGHDFANAFRDLQLCVVVHRGGGGDDDDEEDEEEEEEEEEESAAAAVRLSSPRLYAGISKI